MAKRTAIFGQKDEEILTSSNWRESPRRNRKRFWTKDSWHYESEWKVGGVTDISILWKLSRRGVWMTSESCATSFLSAIGGKW